MEDREPQPIFLGPDWPYIALVSTHPVEGIKASIELGCLAELINDEASLAQKVLELIDSENGEIITDTESIRTVKFECQPQGFPSGELIVAVVRNTGTSPEIGQITLRPTLGPSIESEPGNIALSKIELNTSKRKVALHYDATGNNGERITIEVVQDYSISTDGDFQSAVLIGITENMHSEGLVSLDVTGNTKDFAPTEDTQEIEIQQVKLYATWSLDLSGEALNDGTDGCILTIGYLPQSTESGTNDILCSVWIPTYAAAIAGDILKRYVRSLQE